MADYGFDFRGAAGSVSDPANCSPVLGEVHPNVYGNGATAGWLSASPGFYGEDTGVDPRLAGVNYVSNTGGQATFRITLAATGSHDIRLALGQFDSARPYLYCQLLDDATVIATLDIATGAGSGQWVDATGVLRTSSADWASNNASINYNFASTTFNVKIGHGSQADLTTLAHVRVTTAGGSPETVTWVGYIG